jgi:outer membrane receptor protein involved in Fe transport
MQMFGTGRPAVAQSDPGVLRTAVFAVGATLCMLSATSALADTTATSSDAAAGDAPDSGVLTEVTVTASRIDLLGTATTASQGSVTEQELDLRPAYRVGQLLESVPGLVVTVHSGEGKANQFLARGFNLDHGTDIANFVDDMPINRPTNTHGQGYSDLNFELADVADGLDYTKGPYYASVGDFGSVASTHLKLANDIPAQVSVTGGTLGVYNIFAGGTDHFSDTDRLLGGVYYGHVDGPFDPGNNFRKEAGILRYSHGTQADGYSATLMYYHSLGNLTTDQPLRAIQEGLISRWGTLDPSDGNASQRFSLSLHYATHGDDWKFDSSAYFIHSTMTLWNDFTHYLDDPVNGDQEEQDENRNTGGGQVAFTLNHAFGAVENQIVAGVQLRDDQALIDRKHTLQRVPLTYCSVEGGNPDGSTAQVPAAGGICSADEVHLLDLGPYLEDTSHWLSWLRTVAGVREEYYRATDQSLQSDLGFAGFQGEKSQTLLQPKGSLILGPWAATEFYFSAGRGFHSDDVRGVFGTVPLVGLFDGSGNPRSTPLLAATTGYEFGIRSDIVPQLSMQFAVFQQDFRSELAYDADAGQDDATAPSRRQGVEISAQYHPWSWIEFNTDLASSKARYLPGYENYGLDGTYIANAPKFIGSFGILVRNLGPWTGGLQWRKLGAYPLEDGADPHYDSGYSEFNVDAGYVFNEHLKATLSIFNLFNSHADAAAYYYGTILKPEINPATYTQLQIAGGTSDYQIHPLEPISGEVKITYIF